MTGIIDKSRLILQSDWDSALKEDNTAWVSFRPAPGSPMIHGQLTSHGSGHEGIPSVDANNSFQVLDIDKKRISLRFRGGTKTTFISPVISFATIHGGRKSVGCVDVTSGGLGVSSDVRGQCLLWTTDSGEIRRRLEGHVGDVNACQFFPSGVVVLTCGSDMLLKIWSATTGHCAATLIGHKAGVSSAAVVERGRNIVSCSRDGTARLWDVGTQTCLGTFNDIDGGVLNECTLQHVPINLGVPETSPGEREVATFGKMVSFACESGKIVAYGLYSRKKVLDLQCSSAVNCCSFASDVYLVGGTQDGLVYVFDIRNCREALKVFKEARGAILSLKPHQNGVWTSCSDGSCFYTNAQWESTTELSGPDCDPVYRVAADDSYVYTCCRDGLIRKYRAPNNHRT